MTRVLVTGANGFIGRALCTSLISAGHQVRGLVRSVAAPLDGVEYVTGELTDQALWSSALCDVDCVVHLAARAHVLEETSVSPLETFRAINVHAALAFAKASMDAGVKRFVFISSIGVNGSQTTGIPFSERSVVAPHAPYAVSKFEAEEALQKMLKGSSMELVIVRPPLVYAGHAPGNFKRLLKLVSTGLPLPFATVDNVRSMVSLENLTSLITLCVTHPNAAGELFLVSDDESCSLPEILALLGRGMNKRVLLLPLPVSLMKLAARMVGKTGMVDQLCGSLAIDSTKSRQLLGWTPPRSAQAALIEAGEAYKKSISSAH